MTPIRLLAAAAVTTLLAAPAFAQEPDTAPEDMMNPPPASAPADMTAPAADDAGMPVSATAPVVMRQSSVSPDQAAMLKPGDANVVTNGPVPDTRENRRKYGGPISNGGRQTRPVGN